MSRNDLRPPHVGPLRVARRALGRVALALASVAFAAGVGEVATRLLLPMERGISWYHYDTRYGYRHREGVDQITTEWGERTPWRFHTNAHGFRWPEWPDAPTPGKTRVLVMGDSFTFGNGLDAEQAYPEVADAALRGEGSWEVLNLGTSAWGPENALGFIESEGGSIQGSCLVYGYYEGNDVLDSYIHPVYALQGGALVHLPPKGGPETRTERLRGLMRRVPVYDLLLAHSQLFNLGRSALIRSVTLGDSRAAIDAGKVEDENKLRPETFAKALQSTLAALDGLAALAHERFGGFALLMIPQRERMIEGPDATPPAASSPVWIAQRSYEPVVAWARARGVPVVDASLAIARDPSAAKRLYFSKDFHMNAEGHRLLGELLARQLPAACARGPAGVSAPPGPPGPAR